jgi:thiol-disulfide isomerase/thioredoxin
MNKKVKIILGIVLGAALIGICFFISPDSKQSSLITDPTEIYENAKKQSSNITDAEKKDLIEINVTTYLEKLYQKSKSPILVSRTGCQYCDISVPILQKLAKDYNVDIYELNTANFQEDEISQFVNSASIFKEGFGTPFVMIVQNGEITDYIDGVSDYEHYEDLLSSVGLIK